MSLTTSPHRQPRCPPRRWRGSSRPPVPTPSTPSHSQVGFAVRHLMVSKTRGRFSDFAGTVEIGENPLESSVAVTIQTASIDTRDEQRDGHLRSGDFFDAEAWPTMTYQSRSVRKVGKGRYIVEGDLTIKGVTKPVPLELTFEGGAADPWGGVRIGFSAKAELDREAFGLTLEPGPRDRRRPRRQEGGHRDRGRGRQAVATLPTPPSVPPPRPPLRGRNRGRELALGEPRFWVVSQYKQLVDFLRNVAGGRRGRGTGRGFARLLTRQASLMRLHDLVSARGGLALERSAYPLLNQILALQAGAGRLTDVAAGLEVAVPTVSRQVRQLEDLGLVVRTQGPDRRAGDPPRGDRGRHRRPPADAGGVAQDGGRDPRTLAGEGPGDPRRAAGAVRPGAAGVAC